MKKVRFIIPFNFDDYEDRYFFKNNIKINSTELIKKLHHYQENDMEEIDEVRILNDYLKVELIPELVNFMKKWTNITHKSKTIINSTCLILFFKQAKDLNIKKVNLEQLPLSLVSIEKVAKHLPKSGFIKHY